MPKINFENFNTKNHFFIKKFFSVFYISGPGAIRSKRVNNKVLSNAEQMADLYEYDEDEFDERLIGDEEVTQSGSIQKVSYWASILHSFKSPWAKLSTSKSSEPDGKGKMV